MVGGVILDTNWRFWDTATASDVVGWPQGSTTDPWAYQSIGADCQEYANAGFSAIKLPPSCLGAAGLFSGGYDKKDDYALDGTAFGSGDMLRQCVAAIHAHGMQAYGDLVLHQYDGGKDGVYPLKRFAKTAKCFAALSTKGGVTADPIPDTEGNFDFGDLSAYVYSEPSGYMHDGAIAAAQWLTATVGFDGYRIDDVKGTNAQVVYDILHADGLSELYAVGEYFDGSNGPLSNWVNGYMKRRAAVFDFGFKFNVGNICNNNSRIWMGQLANIGYCSIDPFMAVPFVESADTDNSPGEQVIWNKILGYAIMLTFPGYPMVYYRDWSDDPGCYGLKPWINNLIWIHANLAQGDFVSLLDTDPQVFVHERLGDGDAPGCVCFFNNDQYNAYTRTVQTSLGPHQEVHEYTGNGSYNNIWTDAYGNLTATVPRNNNGMSYLVYAKPLPNGGSPFTRVPRSTKQTFFGAADLGPSDSGSAAVNGSVVVGMVDIAAGSSIEASLGADRSGWDENSLIEFQITDSTGAPTGGGVLDVTGESTQATGTGGTTGWHTIMFTCAGLPADGSSFGFTIQYTAPPTPSALP